MLTAARELSSAVATASVRGSQTHSSWFTNRSRRAASHKLIVMTLTPEQKHRVFQLVVAATRQLGIGKDGTLPWKLPGDMKYFRELTSKTVDPSKQNAVIMGRTTWESIPQKFRPLKGRLNLVLSRKRSIEQPSEADLCSDGPVTCSSIENAMDLLAHGSHAEKIEHVFVIGGGQIYTEAIKSKLCAAIHLTQIDKDFECDTFFPEIDRSRFRLWSAAPPQKDSGTRYSFLCFTAAGLEPVSLPAALASQHEEQQYLDLVADVIKNGAVRPDRTGTGTHSLFGRQMRFNLRHSFPLLTTKRVFWRGVAEELLWFISGSTNAKQLKDKGISIWDGNASRAYLDSIGLSNREEGDLGPVYGFQWRHFGAEYKGMHADYTGQGVDQLASIISRIKTNPEDRRLILSAWNPTALPDMALPPCHLMCQFYVADGELSCQMYQRSCDLGLGVPFNIASYALLTYLIAHTCNLQPGDLVHTLGDAHVYSNHVEPLKEQMRNRPRPFPVLSLPDQKKDMDAFVYEDLRLDGYQPHAKIAMQMAV